jgi:hypothetical protein
MWHSRLTNTRGRILHGHALQHNYEIIGPHTPAHFPANCNHRPDVLDIAFIRIYAVPTYIESVEVLSSDHNPVILVMGLEPHETSLQRMDPFAVRHWLKQTIPGNPTITSVEEIDSGLIIFTSCIETEKKPRNCIIHFIIIPITTVLSATILQPKSLKHF